MKYLKMPVTTSKPKIEYKCLKVKASLSQAYSIYLYTWGLRKDIFRLKHRKLESEQQWIYSCYGEKDILLRYSKSCIQNLLYYP